MRIRINADDNLSFPCTNTTESFRTRETGNVIKEFIVNSPDASINDFRQYHDMKNIKSIEVLDEENNVVESTNEYLRVSQIQRAIITNARGSVVAAPNSLVTIIFTNEKD